MPKDARAEARCLRDYYARQDRVRCMVCGRHLLTRDKKGWACSRVCAERLKESQASEPLGGPTGGGG
jgi:hypothetical protein